tara:strand:- start:10 stop:1203 length:1194 start_codon:yes stop_codon:yes gene_type:complete
MGCGSSKRVEPRADPLAAVDFELSTPMLVMPFRVFKKQGRIVKSTKTWRDEALSKSWLVAHVKTAGDVPAPGKVVIFISHTWWDRDFKDETCDPSLPHDVGAPDHQSGERKDLKWRIICAGVETLIKEKRLKAEDVLLWVDWQSIHQDDNEEKLKGVRSLIKYATLCDYMLVPTEEEELVGWATKLPHLIPGYGLRGWCRCEYFIFSLAAEMREREVPLYAIQRDGSLKQYPRVELADIKYMPSRGQLSNPADWAPVQALEDKMIEEHGKVLAEIKCKAGAGGSVDLGAKMIRDCHVEALCAAVVKYEVTWLRLDTNQLGDEGAKAIAAMLRANRSLKDLSLLGNKIGDAGAEAIAAMLRVNRSLNYLDLRGNDIGHPAKQSVRDAVMGRKGFQLDI